MVIESDEALAWTVFIKLLTECSDWRRFYGENTPKLFEVTKNLREYMKKEMPKLSRYLNEQNVILESLFASPLLTMFGNLIPISEALRVIDRYILGKESKISFTIDGEEAIYNIMKHLLKSKEQDMLKMDCWELQVFLGRNLYIQAVEDN